MNRQQRRLMAKRKEVEAKHYKALVENQLHIDGWQLELNLLCFALSVHKAYGWGQKRIARGMVEFNEQLLRFNNKEDPDKLREELEAETGLWITFSDDAIHFDRRRKM